VNKATFSPALLCPRRSIPTRNGVLAKFTPADYTWSISVNFSRFDGDTLTGAVDGYIEAVT
jgi:hypothetical protein